MPWKETDPLREQQKFVTAWMGETETPFLELCQRYGISRKSGYKRVSRFKELGLEGVGDLARSPRTHPNQTPAGIVEMLVNTKHQHMTYGPRKLLVVINREHPELVLPAPSTASKILKEHGLVRSRRCTRKSAPWAAPFSNTHQPNDTWCADFKGWFRTSDQVRINPLTITDSASRYLIACTALKRPTFEQVQPVFELAFREFGLPHAMRTDNGPPFSTISLGGLSKLSIWWIKLGITPERIRPGHPEENGRHERMHRTLKDAVASPPKSSFRAQQKAFNWFIDDYNEVRPHEALGQKTPASTYFTSSRNYPNRIDQPEYADNVTIRRVRTNGEIRWKGSLVFISQALVGEPIGLKQITERTWAIYYGPLDIGILDETTMKTIKTPVKVLPMSPD
jgi:transposase InsO family protein